MFKITLKYFLFYCHYTIFIVVKKMIRRKKFENYPETVLDFLTPRKSNGHHSMLV